MLLSTVLRLFGLKIRTVLAEVCVKIVGQKEFKITDTDMKARKHVFESVAIAVRNKRTKLTSTACDREKVKRLIIEMSSANCLSMAWN